jgi:NAD+ synthase (glutamine-hydrolysing)
VKLALAQLNTRVGAIEYNTRKLGETIERARDECGCSLVVFPELAVSGYPPEDLLLHSGLRNRVADAFLELSSAARDICACFGYPEYADGAIFNSAAVVRNGEVLANHRKWVLPNYSVFDEKRYFLAGESATVFNVDGVTFGLVICEDAWSPEPCAAVAAAGADVILVTNGSPFHLRQREAREQVIAARARETGLPVLYVNMIGGQDELVFDGGSFALDATGTVIFRARQFEETLTVIEISPSGGGLTVVAQMVEDATSGADGHAEHGVHREPLKRVASVYQALVLGTRDYIEKNNFPGVILGLSGGVDSALTLAVAADAIGPERVRAVMMPSRFTSQMSLEDAASQAKALGVRYDVLPIEPIVGVVEETLSPIFEGRARDSTEENIQARARGILLMAISNKLGSMLLSTGNKSEMAVGYATLYGDMAGGFAPLKDCSKTLVYELAKFRNSRSVAIPLRVLDREPSAELAADQKDSDSLPPYERLDAILEAFIERDESVDQISAAGFERSEVLRVLHMVKRAEYKRRQAPPGVRVSSRAFGRDWRYPITSGY